MAAEAGEKTEAPTPRRRAEARAKGQVARSQDLVAALMLLGGFAALGILGPRIWIALLSMVSAGLRADSSESVHEVLLLAAAMVIHAGKSLLPFLLVLIAVALAALYIQTGWLFTWHPLKPSLSRLSPQRGLQRLFSIRSVFHALISIAKLLIVVAVAYFTLAAGLPVVLHAVTLGFEEMVRLAGSLIYRLGIRTSVALLVLALLDWAWQRYRHERDLRMTKEEVKDELRSMEGNPAVKRRQRQVQMQLAVQRLRRDVPKADVIVTNPTHVAVAIAYEAQAMLAPKVVAKGADEMALRIRQIAIEFSIPIVERKPLARALYDAVDVGDCIPERFYKAIAEILAYVYELSGRSKRWKTA